MADQALNTEVTPDTGSSALATEHTERSSEPKSRRELRREERAKTGGSSTRAAIEQAAKSDKVSRGTVEPNDGAENVGGEEKPKPWEAPKYASAWKEQRRKALEAIATNPALQDHWKELDGQLGEFHDWDSRRNWEIGNYRKRFEPIQDIIGALEQQYTLQGMSLQQGLGQMVGVAQRLQQDPDSTLAQLGVWYKPRNAGQVLQYLAQTWGTDLGQLAQGQPYVDPVVAKQLRETQAQLQQTQQSIAQQQNAQRQQQYQALYNHIAGFETEKDASGNLKHPYAAEVGSEMGLLLQLGKAQSLDQAYEMATKYHPKAQEERAKAAEKAAREAAARNTTEAEHARAAGRNVASKPNGRDTRITSMNDAILRAERTVYGKTR